MPDPRELAGDEMTASRAEVEFNRVVGIASTRRDRGELSAGAYAVILDRARKSRDAASDDLGRRRTETKGGQVRSVGAPLCRELTPTGELLPCSSLTAGGRP